MNKAVKDEKRCYVCDEPHCTHKARIVESPKDIDCPPLAWICDKCEVDIEEQ